MSMKPGKILVGKAAVFLLLVIIPWWCVQSGRADASSFHLFSRSMQTAQTDLVYPLKDENFDELIAKRQAEEKEWADWQNRLIDTWRKVEKLEKKGDVGPGEKARAWDGLLREFNRDNPYSDVDQVIRRKARSRKEFWLKKAQSLSLHRKQPFVNRIGMKFILIPAGRFMMGCPDDEPGADGYDSPRHQVDINRPFYVQTTEVSRIQWKMVMGTNPTLYPDCGDDCPVDNVSWDDAMEFINRLNMLEKNGKYRLPTEAEWEYACRAGTDTAYAGGNLGEESCPDTGLDKMAWHCGESPGPAAKKKPNSWGLYDMHGNVWEWCSDWFYEYTAQAKVDPQGPLAGTWKTIRGGSFCDESYQCRSAQRSWEKPQNTNDTIGFRVVRDL